jgi:hypothetical protein
MSQITANRFPPTVKSSLRLPPKVATPRSSLVLQSQPEKQPYQNHYIFWDLDNICPPITVPFLQGDPRHTIHDSLDAIHLVAQHALAAPLKLSHACVVANTATWSTKPWCITTTNRPNIFIAKTSQDRKQSADVELTKLIIGQLVILKRQGRLNGNDTNHHLPVFTLVSEDTDFVQLMEYLSSKVVTISMTMHSVSFKHLGGSSSSNDNSRGKYPVRTSKFNLDKRRLAQVAHHTAMFALNSTEQTQEVMYSDDNNATGQCNRNNNNSFTPPPPFVLHESWTNPKYLC